MEDATFVARTQALRATLARSSIALDTAKTISTCTHPQMPNAAIATCKVDFIAAPEELGPVVAEFVARLDLTRPERWSEPFRA